MKKFLLSIPYIYPLCPLNFSHAKMFVIADVLNRYYLLQGYNVIFPVASHYSGNTAQKMSEIFSGSDMAVRKDTYNLYRKTYTTPNYIVDQFTDSKKLLDYYTQETYWELKNLSIGCDYQHSYSTDHPDFAIFVRTMISCYKKAGILIKNKDNDLALNYDDKAWKNNMIELLNTVEVQTENHKKDMQSAIKNIRSDWGILRQNGFGVKYDKDWVIDPMFDSELFNIFDLYMIYKDDLDIKISRDEIFESLFESLKSGEKSRFDLVGEILKQLPCKIFICEEHLKNWTIKKLYTEVLLLHPKFRTKKYLVLGMGMLDKKRMSASRGHAILSRDLINQLGGVKARAVMLLSGGNISKQYNYDKSLVPTVDMMIKNLNDFIINLESITKNLKLPVSITDKDLRNTTTRIEKFIEEGLFRQAFLELISIIPGKYKKVSGKLALEVKVLYNKYLDIFLPGFLAFFKNG